MPAFAGMTVEMFQNGARTWVALTLSLTKGEGATSCFDKLSMRFSAGSALLRADQRAGHANFHGLVLQAHEGDVHALFGQAAAVNLQL